MDVTDFYKYIENPKLLNASTLAELQEVLETYPYFQTVHILYLKSLYNQNNFKFNEQLKFSSVHVNNRKKLLFYLKKNPSKIILDDTEKIDKQIILPVTKPNSSIDKEKKVAKIAVQGLTKPLLPKKDVKENEELDTKSIVENVEKEVEKTGSLVVEQQNTITPKQEKVKETILDKSGSVVKLPLSEKKTSKPILIEKQDKQEDKKVEIEVNALSPQEIIQKRIEEIIKGGKKDKQALEINRGYKTPQKKTNKPPIEGTLDSVAKDKKLISQFVQEKGSDDLSDISDLIQIAAPTEYFLENIEDIKKDKEQADLNSSDKQSFSYWLNHLQEIKEREEEPKLIRQILKEDSKQKKTSKNKISLIDSFLADKSSKIIKLSKEKKVQDVKNDNPLEDRTGGFMTETLAQIYIKQSYYEKAIEAYEKLSLKYPKKNTYFASQIEKIKTLQLNS